MLIVWSLINKLLKIGQVTLLGVTQEGKPSHGSSKFQEQIQRSAGLGWVESFQREDP